MSAPSHPGFARPARQTGRARGLLLGAGILAAVVIVVAGSLLWFRRADAPEANSGLDVDLSQLDVQARLMRNLPPGYGPGVCTVDRATNSAVAAVTCGPNAEPSSPTSASYALFGDVSALRAQLNTIIDSTAKVGCPGNILSPGPWRRSASPKEIAGTLYCGTSSDQPVIAWTTEDQLTLSRINADAAGPTFDQLYQWWSLHS